jgi:hypothetical protein
LRSRKWKAKSINNWTQSIPEDRCLNHLQLHQQLIEAKIFLDATKLPSQSTCCISEQNKIQVAANHPESKVKYTVFVI